MIEILKNFGVGFVIVLILGIIEHFHLGGIILSTIFFVVLTTFLGWFIRDNIKINIIKNKKDEDTDIE